MAAAATPFNGKEKLAITLPVNTPQTIAFETLKGRNHGPSKYPPYRERVIFYATDGRPLFLDAEEADDLERGLQEIGANAGDPVRITKASHGRGGGFSIRVEPYQAVASRIPAASAPTSNSQTLVVGNVQPAAPAPATTVEPAQINTRVMSAYAAAIDTLIAARQYAQQRGLAIEIRCEDVRCLAATLMIDGQKGGR